MTRTLAALALACALSSSALADASAKTAAATGIGLAWLTIVLPFFWLLYQPRIREGLVAWFISLAIVLLPTIVLAAPLAIIGDCLATAPYGLGGQFRGATVRARVGLPSRSIIGLARPGDGYTIISLGSNDITRATPPVLIPKLRATLVANAEATRARLTGRAGWAIPTHPVVAAAVRQVAAAHGDDVCPFVAGRDGVHPRSYAVLAACFRPHIAAPPAAAAR